MSNEQLLTVADVAKMLNVSPKWVYGKYEDGSLPGAKIGRYLRFRETDIQGYVAGAFARH